MGKDTVIGLDIGSMSIRATEIRRGKAGPTIANFGTVPLPPEATKGGVLLDEKAVTAALKQLWAGAKFRSRRVVLGVTSRQAVVRTISVADLPTRELRKSLPFQVRDMLPLAVEKSLLDFYPLEVAGDAKTVRVLLIAAPKDAVLAAVNATERAGLHVERVDLAPFALIRAASRLDDQVEAIVDIGAQSTTVVVHADGEPLIVRTIPRGGAEITEMIAGRLGVDTGGAEALKCRVGMYKPDEPETADLIKEGMRPLINEIRSSFAYLSSGEQHRRVGRLALSGGGAGLPGLVDALSTQFGIDVVLADPLVRLHDGRRRQDDGLERFRSSAAVSIGLTLGVLR
jgi:type IV pilus assembly protein PilM